MSPESLIASAWIAARLGGDAPLVALLDPSGTGAVKVRKDLARPEWAPPWIVWTLFSGAGPSYVGGGGIIWGNSVWTLDILTLGNDSTVIEPIIRRVDALLNNQRGAILDGTVSFCRRRGERSYAETTGGLVYQHSQMDYEIRARGPQAS